TAASRSAAVRSGVFNLAISSACARVSLPTLSVCGLGLPLSTFAAFMISTVAGGVFITNVKLLSAKAVMTTGIGRPGSSFCVCALNALQNSMMFKPRWPSAGPIGGLGFALPAGTCSLMNPTTFFAISYSPWVQASRQALPVRLCFLDLRKIQLNRRRPPEDRDRHAQLALLVVHVLHVAVEIRERTFLDPYRFAQLEQHLRPRLFDTLLHLLQDRVDVLLRDRRRLVGRAAHEARHLRRALHEMPGVVGHFHFDQNVAWKELALRDRACAVFHLDHFLDRHEDLAELIRHARALDPLVKRALHALFEA